MSRGRVLLLVMLILAVLGSSVGVVYAKYSSRKLFVELVVVGFDVAAARVSAVRPRPLYAFAQALVVGVRAIAVDPEAEAEGGARLRLGPELGDDVLHDAAAAAGAEHGIEPGAHAARPVDEEEHVDPVVAL